MMKCVKDFQEGQQQEEATIPGCFWGAVPKIMKKVKIMKMKEAKSSLIVAHMGIDLEGPRESTKNSWI